MCVCFRFDNFFRTIFFKFTNPLFCCVQSIVISTQWFFSFFFPIQILCFSVLWCPCGYFFTISKSFLIFSFSSSIILIFYFGFFKIFMSFFLQSFVLIPIAWSYMICFYFLNWSVVDLQCFRWTSKWFIYIIYIHISSDFFHYRLLQNIEDSVV